jgi:hypothetical protein
MGGLYIVEDEKEAMRQIVSKFLCALMTSEIEALKSFDHDKFYASLKATPGFKSSPIKVLFKTICETLDKDLVVFFHSADYLSLNPRMSFLSQIKAGYLERDNAPFPRSIVLSGRWNPLFHEDKLMLDSKFVDLASPFHMATGNLTLADFTYSEVKELYSQHTEATGQVFQDAAIQRAFYLSEGQPMLVNSLAYQVVDKILAKDYSQTVTAAHIDQAADNLVKKRRDNIDTNMDRLQYSWAKRVIEPMLMAMDAKDLPVKPEPDKSADSFIDDFQRCLDLGFIKGDITDYRPSNPIYASAISRRLYECLIIGYTPKNLAGKWIDGQSVDMSGLLKEFQAFWVENSDEYLIDTRYKEAAPRFLLSAFIQSALNDEANVIEEYALLWGYADIAVKFAGQNYAIELKLKDAENNQTKAQKQLLLFMDRLMTKEGWLVTFHRETDKTWRKKLSWETSLTPEGQTIHMVGL